MRVQLRISALIIVAILMQGCASMLSLPYGTDDLYQTNTREQVVAAIDARNEAIAAQRAQYEAQAAQSEMEAAVDYNSVLVTDYQTAYARRLYGFESPTYRMPASYYSMATSEAIYYASAYDPAFYNVMVSGDQVWVEPKYITSMFGSWGATNVTFGLYASPWMYGWSSCADPFYYAWWGYPRYSWYDWNWTMCYGSFYFGWGYPSPFYPGYYPGYYPFYPGFYPPHHNPGFGPRPPHHRPQHNAPGGRANHNFNGTGAHYTSPTTNRNYGAGASDDGGRPTYSGSKSTGIYNGKSTNSGNRSREGVTQNTRGERGNATQQNRERSNNYRQGGNSGRSTTTTIRSNSGSRSGGFSSGGGFGGGSSSRSGGTTSTRR